MGAILRLGDPAKAFWLTRSVARTMGINLSGALAEGRLTSEGYAEMVTRCRTCNQVEQCELWLARSGAGASSAPADCANADIFNRLKKG